RAWMILCGRIDEDCGLCIQCICELQGDLPEIGFYIRPEFQKGDARKPKRTRKKTAVETDSDVQRRSQGTCHPKYPTNRRSGCRCYTRSCHNIPLRRRYS